MMHVYAGKKTPSLDEAQRLVGGVVELLHLSPVREEPRQLLINGFGLTQELVHNPEASRIAGRMIVGDAVLLIGPACWKEGV